jgi:hypothetical protein
MLGLALVTIISATTLIANRKPKIQNNDYSTINFKARSTGLFDDDEEYEENEDDLLLSKEKENGTDIDPSNGSSFQKEKKVDFVRLDENPQDHVGLFSKIAFTWMTNFMKSGIKMTYAIDDLYPPKKGKRGHYFLIRTNRIVDHYSELHYRKLNDIWQEEMKKPKPSLAKAVFVGYRKPLIAPLVLRFFADALTLLGPILLKKCIEFAGEPDQPLYIGFAYAFALFASAALMAVFNNSYFMSLLNIGANVSIQKNWKKF